jgi:nucleoside recognition membrane protein YjiH
MKNSFSKYIMLVVGFVLLFVNGVGYIFNLNLKNLVLVVIGIVFVVIGMKKIHKK